MARRLRLLLGSLLGGALLTTACSAPAASTPSVGSSALTAGPTTTSSVAASSATSTVTSPEPSAPGTTTADISTAAPSEAPSPPVDSAPSDTAPVELVGDPTDVVTGLAAPWSIAFVGSSPLISERDSGRIIELAGAGVREVGVVDGVVHASEGGLLGLAVLAGDAPYLYAYFTAADDNRIVRYPLTGAPGSYGLGPVEAIFSGIPKANNHNGGRIKFGPDGMLYVTAGDAGVRDNAQDPDSLSGKILRLTPDGAVPADNPIQGNPLWSLGHRNPQGIGWDATGTMWAAEFGQDTWDELNIITPGANYGWPVVEGIGDDDRYVNPVQQWGTDDASPSGLAVAGGSIFIANLKGERLREVHISDPAASTEHFSGGYGRLRDVVVAPDGTLWVLTNNTDGRGDPASGDDRILGVQLSQSG